VAPEVKRGEQCSVSADIWSIGCLLFEMIFKKGPRNDGLDHGYATNEHRVEEQLRNEGCVEEAIALITATAWQMLDRRPEGRPAARELKRKYYKLSTTLL
jgi:serine/threonine protein kinase